MFKIKLHEIPEDGKTFHFNRETAELNQELKDLIENSNYNAEVSIKPLNSRDYEVKGQITTQTTEICSLCGEKFKFNIKTSFHELLIPASEDYKNSQFSKSNHVSELNEEGPGVIEYKNEIFAAGEYLHEAIAISVPYNPKPEINDDGSCKVCLKAAINDTFTYDEKMGEEVKINPFQALKGIKLN